MSETDTNPSTDQAHRLLVIDDSEEIIDVLADVGEHAGYTVRSALDLQRVEAVYAEFEPSVILLDLGLGSPGGVSGTGDEGLEVLEYLSSQKCKSRIIIISGMSRRKRELTQIQGQGMHLRVIGHLPKPFNINKVEEMLIKLKEKSD